MSPQHKAWLKCCPSFVLVPSLAPPCPLSKTAARPPPGWPASVPGFSHLSWSLLVPGTARVTVWSLLMLTPHQGASHHISAGSHGHLLPEPSLLCPCPLPFSEFLAPNPPWSPDPVAVSTPPPLVPVASALGSLHSPRCSAPGGRWGDSFTFACPALRAGCPAAWGGRPINSTAPYPRSARKPLRQAALLCGPGPCCPATLL